MYFECASYLDNFVVIWYSTPNKTHSQDYQTQRSQVTLELSGLTQLTFIACKRLGALDRSGILHLAANKHVQGTPGASALCKYTHKLCNSQRRCQTRNTEPSYQGCKFPFDKTETTFADLQILYKITFTDGRLATNILLQIYLHDLPSPFPLLIHEY